MSERSEAGTAGMDRRVRSDDTGVKELKERLKREVASLQRETAMDNLYLVRKKAEDVIEILNDMQEIEKRERLLVSLEKWHPELPLTPERFEAFQEKRHMSIEELNRFFAPLGLNFRRFSIGGGRAIWYTQIGMNVNDAGEAANAPKEMKHSRGDARRILRYEYHAGDAWYGDTATITEVTLLTTKDPQFNEEARTRYQEVRDMINK